MAFTRVQFHSVSKLIFCIIRLKIILLALLPHVPGTQPCGLSGSIPNVKPKHYITLQWRHDGRHGVSISSDQHLDCLLNRSFRRRTFKYQSSASLAFVREIHRSPVNFPHKGPVTRKFFPFDDVIMISPHTTTTPNPANDASSAPSLLLKPMLTNCQLDNK